MATPTTVRVRLGLTHTHDDGERHHHLAGAGWGADAHSPAEVQELLGRCLAQSLAQITVLDAIDVLAMAIWKTNQGVFQALTASPEAIALADAATAYLARSRPQSPGAKKAKEAKKEPKKGKPKPPEGG